MKKMMLAALLTLNASAFANTTALDTADFLHHQDQIEIAASELALAQSSSAEVQKYARRTADNHRQSNSVLLTLAKAAGKPITDLDLYDAKLAALKSLSGREFDRAFAQLMVIIHQDSLREIAQADPTDAIGAFAHVTEARVANGLAGAIGLLH